MLVWWGLFRLTRQIRETVRKIMNQCIIRAQVWACVAILITASLAQAAPQYVIAISVDGMGSNYVTPLLTPGANQLTNFLRFQNEGAGTLNARDDLNAAITLPEHTTMITSRGVSGAAGHNWTSNVDPLPGQTIASNKGSYVASVFDVVHDNAMRTGIWAGKSKFSLFQTSYSITTGALDTTGADNGRDKIDYDNVPAVGTTAPSAATLASDFTTQMTANPFNFAFVHFQDPDATGHNSGWSTDRTSAFATTLKAVDTQIGNILKMVHDSPTLNGNTTIILTADHGGHDKTHGITTNPLDYTIPFYVWGAGVTAGSDLYTLNLTSRTAPGVNVNPGYTGGQPVRDGDMGNLALDLLGLGPIPDSTINRVLGPGGIYVQNLVVPEPSTLVLLLMAGLGLAWRVLSSRRRKNA